MTQYLPQNLLALFAPRDPIPYLPPTEKLPHEKTNCHNYAGVGAFLAEFEDPKDTPPPTRVETKDERKERKRKERAEQIAYKLEQDLALWDPTNDPTILGDPFKTLFVARINYDSSESKLRREFEVYGPVKRISLVHSQTNGKPRGYAFIEFEHERDMHSAYKHADGKKIDGRRVLVDVERGRTVKGWRPRRLGGGLGGTRRGGPDMNSKYSGREENQNRNRRSHHGGYEVHHYNGYHRHGSQRHNAYNRRSRSASPRGLGSGPGPSPGLGGGRDRRRRSRSRDRVRKRRSRSRDRKRRSRSRDKGGLGGGQEEDRPPRRRRSRSKDRGAARRSRSRDRKRSRRSRSPRDRKSGRRGGGGGGERDENGRLIDPEEIKQEKISGKTPPHEPPDNGFRLKEEPDVDRPPAVGFGAVGPPNGAPDEQEEDQPKPLPPPPLPEAQPAEETNEYGSME